MSQCIPKKTAHRKNLPAWISPQTSNPTKRLNTLLKHLKNSVVYHSNLERLQDAVERLSDEDLQTNEAEIFESRNTDKIFKHFRKLKRTSGLPPMMKYRDTTAVSSSEKANAFNRYF